MNEHPQQTYNQYKLRVISWNKNGSVYGLTFPREIAEEIINIKFTINKLDNGDIVLKSGLDIANLKEEIKQNWEKKRLSGFQTISN